MKKIIQKSAIALAVLAAAGCNLENDQAQKQDSAAGEGKILFGTFGNNIENLRYVSRHPEHGNAFEGRTDRRGRFYYAQGDSVTFFLGDHRLGTIEGQRFSSPAHLDEAIQSVNFTLPEPDAEDPECPDEEDDLEIPPQCDEDFPDEGIMESTLRLMNALVELNLESSEDHGDRIYIDSDREQRVASEFLDGDGEVDGNLDTISLLAHHAMYPLHELSPYEVELINDQDAEDCDLGRVQFRLHYHPGPDDTPGYLGLTSKGAVIEVDPATGEGPIELSSDSFSVGGTNGRIYSLFPSIEIESATASSFVGQLDLSLTLSDTGIFVGSYEWARGDDVCGGRAIGR